MITPAVNALDDVKKIYAAWQKKYNMMIVNEDFEYAWVKKCNPCKDQSFTYVYKSADGEPKGYITFAKVDEPSGRNLHCKRFVYSDREGFKGLMNLIRSLASDHNYVTFELPLDQFILPLFPEWAMGAGIKSISQCGMVRVINVKKVLENAAYKGTGSLVIGVSDKYISENNNTFSVEFENGKAISVSTVSKDADIRMNINDFSRLITGVCRTEDIDFLEDVEVHTDMDTIGKVFYQKPVCLLEYF